MTASCPDPWGHRRLYEANEQTWWRRALGQLPPEPEGECPWCGAAVPTVDAAAVAEAALTPDSPRFGPAEWDPIGEFWWRERLADAQFAAEQERGAA